MIFVGNVENIKRSKVSKPNQSLFHFTKVQMSSGVFSPLRYAMIALKKKKIVTVKMLSDRVTILPVTL